MDGAFLERLLDVAALRPGAQVLDVGCGKGDLLVRLAKRAASGTGIDRNPAFIHDAEVLAAAAGVTDRLRFLVGDAATCRLPDGLDLAACVGATGALGGPARAPAALRDLVRPGGWILIGEVYWRVPPEAAWLATWGIPPDELLDRYGTIARMADAGLTLVVANDATADAWESYEDDYAAAIERWAASHPDDPEHDAFLARAAFMRASWAEWRRMAMGFVMVLLRRR